MSRAKVTATACDQEDTPLLRGRNNNDISSRITRGAEAVPARVLLLVAV